MKQPKLKNIKDYVCSLSIEELHELKEFIDKEIISIASGTIDLDK